MTKRNSVAAWLIREKQETLDALRHNIFRNEEDKVPDTIGGVTKVNVQHVSVEQRPDSIPAMPNGKVRTVIKPSDVRIPSSNGKAWAMTKTDPKSTPYRYDDNGQLVRRFTDGYGDDPWQLLEPEKVKAMASKPYRFKPSGKPEKVWRKGNERPIVTDRLGRKVV
jgi:hypothetical protein